MKKTYLILFGLLLSKNALSQCDILDEKYVSFLNMVHVNGKRIFIETPDNPDDVTKQFIKSVNNYVNLFNANHRSHSFHSEYNTLIKKSSKEITKKRLKKIYSIFKIYPESIRNSFIKTAKQKHKESLYCLGRIYEHGIGVTVNYIEAWAWYNTAFAVDGIYAKKHRDRVWEHLNWEAEIEAQKLSDQYTYKYTNITNTPSTTVIR